MARLTLKQVDAALAARGIPERLAQGNGYLYFYDGRAAGWYSSSVPVCRLNHLTLQDYLDAHRELATSRYNWCAGFSLAEYNTTYPLNAGK